MLNNINTSTANEQIQYNIVMLNNINTLTAMNK